jgi:hypothetical protein
MSRCDDWAEGWEEGRQEGEADMLAKCIAAVDALYQVSEPWTGNIHLSEVIGVLRALQEKPTPPPLPPSVGVPEKRWFK